MRPGIILKTLKLLPVSKKIHEEFGKRECNSVIFSLCILTVRKEFKQRKMVTKYLREVKKITSFD